MTADNSQPKFSASDVSRIAARAARGVAESLSVTGVTISGGDSGYSEVHVTVGGCHTAPCHVVISVFRDVSEQVLHDTITAKLQAHLRG